MWGAGPEARTGSLMGGNRDAGAGFCPNGMWSCVLASLVPWTMSGGGLGGVDLKANCLQVGGTVYPLS